jgi:hypothetical protein
MHSTAHRAECIEALFSMTLPAKGVGGSTPDQQGSRCFLCQSCSISSMSSALRLTSPAQVIPLTCWALPMPTIAPVTAGAAAVSNSTISRGSRPLSRLRGLQRSECNEITISAGVGWQHLFGGCLIFYLEAV